MINEGVQLLVTRFHRVVHRFDSQNDITGKRRTEVEARQTIHGVLSLFVSIAKVTRDFFAHVPK